MKISPTAALVIATLLLLMLLCGCRSTETDNSQLAVNKMREAGQQANEKNSPEGIDKSRLPTPESPYLKVYVNKSGEITLNGQKATLEEVEKAFKALARDKGVVLYSREAPEENEPHPNALQVIKLVTQNRLPVRLCADKDCAEALDANGKLIIEK